MDLPVSKCCSFNVQDNTELRLTWMRKVELKALKSFDNIIQGANL
jgi:hypothetical protein